MSALGNASAGLSGHFHHHLQDKLWLRAVSGKLSMCSDRRVRALSVTIRNMIVMNPSRDGARQLRVHPSRRFDMYSSQGT